LLFCFAEDFGLKEFRFGRFDSSTLRITILNIIFAGMTGRTTPEPADSNSTAPSSPPEVEKLEDTQRSPLFGDDEIKKLKEEEKQARVANQNEERQRQKKLALKYKKKPREVSKAEREIQAKQLDELLSKSAVSIAEKSRFCF